MVGKHVAAAKPARRRSVRNRAGNETAGPAPVERPVVGVLMLDTRFPRYPGDIGNLTAIPYPALYRRVPRATVRRVACAEPLPPELLEIFVTNARALLADGAELVVTSCGFLHAEQAALARALTVPVVTSALVLLPLVYALHGARGPIGVLTFDANALGAAHLGVGRGLPLVVQGMERSAHFHRVIADDLESADREAMERDALAAARELARAGPAAVVLECTNLSPYRAAIRDALGGVAVFDLHDAIACCAGALRGGEGR